MVYAHRTNSHSTNMMRRVVISLLLLLAAPAALASGEATTSAAAAAADAIESSIPDTKENRMAQAKRVLMGQPIEETLEGIVQEAVKVKGPQAAEEIRAAIARSDTSEMSKAMERAYATTFSAAELAFLADYANSEIGRRVQKKMPNYVAKVHPAMKAYAQEIFEDVRQKEEAAKKEQHAGGKKKKAKAVPAEGIKAASGEL